MKQSPTPWKFCEVRGQINAPEYRIADLPDYESNAEQIATGHLMASAPELLAALRLAVEAAQQGINGYSWEDGALAAITKAIGGEHV